MYLELKQGPTSFFLGGSKKKDLEERESGGEEVLLLCFGTTRSGRDEISNLKSARG